MSSVADFRSKIISQGMAKTARYKVVVNGFPTSSVLQQQTTILQSLPYLCEIAEFPGKTLNTSDIHYYGPSIKLPFQSVFNTTSLTFLCTEAMSEKKFFELWMNYINGAAFGYDATFREDYITTIDVTSFAETQSAEDSGMFQMTLNQAYPVSMAPMPASWADDNIHRLIVDFTYTDYTVKIPT